MWITLRLFLKHIIKIMPKKTELLPSKLLNFYGICRCQADSIPALHFFLQLPVQTKNRFLISFRTEFPIVCSYLNTNNSLYYCDGRVSFPVIFRNYFFLSYSYIEFQVPCFRHRKQIKISMSQNVHTLEWLLTLGMSYSISPSLSV